MSAYKKMVENKLSVSNWKKKYDKKREKIGNKFWEFDVPDQCMLRQLKLLEEFRIRKSFW